jgi:PAS domain S-box-containing protein
VTTSASLTALDERLEEALQASGIGVWEWDLTTGAIRVSSAVGPLYGLAPGEGQPTARVFVNEYVHRDDRHKLDAAFDLLVNEDRPADLRFRALTVDGGERLLDAHARLVRDREGRPLRLVGVVHDAGYGDRRFRELADSAPVLMWATGPDLACTFFNASYLRFTGRRMEDELGEGWRDLVHPDDLAIIDRADARAADGNAPFEARYRLRRHDGVYRWMHDSGIPVFDAEGRFAGLAGGMVDLHDLIEREVMLDGIFSGAPVGLALFDPGLRIRRVNESYAAMTGLDAEEHEGRQIEEVFPGIATAATAMLAQVLRTGEPASGTLVARAGEGQPRRRFEASFIPLVLPGGEVAGLASMVTEITDRHEAQQERERLLVAERSARREIEAAHARASFLAAVSSTLARSQRLGDALHEVCELSIREVADIVAIDVIPRHGDALERVAVAALDAGARREMRRTIGHVRAIGGEHAIGGVALSGVPLWVRDAAAARLNGPLGFGDMDADVTRGVRMHACGVVPLVARDSVVGVMSLGWQDGRAEPGGLERELIDDLARRIAVSIDNAQLLKERAEVASTLQTALLPPELPEIEGVELAARYLPADEASEVGGDFYDVFRAGAGWGVLVGDVCGKGAKAAALTALARYTVRAGFAAGAPGPAEALALLDGALLDDGGGDHFVTAVLGLLERQDDGSTRLRLACGGHPSPIVLRADGRREVCGPDGRVVGIPLDGTWDVAELSLGPGDAVLLYTDGVTEADRRDPLLPRELADLLPAEVHALDTGALADVLERMARERGGERLRDDVAVIALKVGG